MLKRKQKKTEEKKKIYAQNNSICGTEIHVHFHLKKEILTLFMSCRA